MSWKERARAALRTKHIDVTSEVANVCKEGNNVHDSIVFLMDSFLGNVQAAHSMDYSITSLSSVEGALRSLATKHGVDNEWVGMFARQASNTWVRSFAVSAGVNGELLHLP